MEVEQRQLEPFCRGCLTSHKLMQSLHKKPLKDDFLKFTDVKVIESETLSSWLCMKCSMLFHQMQAFKKRASLIDTLLRTHTEDLKINIEEYEIIEEKYKAANPIPQLDSVTVLHACTDCDDATISPSVKISNFRVDIKIEDISDNNSDNDDKVPDQNPSFVEVYFENDESDFIASDPMVKINENVMKDEGKRKKINANDKKRKRMANEENERNMRKKMKKSSISAIDMSKVLVIEIPPKDQLKELDIKRTAEDFCQAKYKCEHCVKVFPYEESLQNHMARHDKSYGICECSICHQRFSDKRILKNHFATHTHRYTCRLCNRQFHFKNNLADHLLKHDNIYLCRICDHQSDGKESYHLHIKTHANAEASVCDICSKVINNKRAYQKHMRRHTGDMPFTCEECGKHFQTNAMLVIHKTVHSNARNYYCEVCDVSFKTRDIMLAHLKRNSKHIDPNILKFPCDLCKKKFGKESQLKAHVDNFHLRHARIACDTCPARFVSANGLRNHRKRKHEGVKPMLAHICETCGRGFSTKALVTNHIRTHTGEKPFKCEKCNRSFTQKSAMQTHIKIIHLKMKREKKNRNKKATETETEAENVSQ